MGGETAGEIAYVSPYHEVLINSEFSWWKDDYQEFYFNLNKSRMGASGYIAYRFIRVYPACFR